MFLVSGLWHGANWTFVIWGTLHGFYLVFALITKNIRNTMANFIGLNKFPRINNLLQISITFVLVTFAWIFFRANSVSNAFYIIKHSITGLYQSIFNAFHHLPLNLNLGLAKKELLFSVAAIIFMEVIHIIQNKYKIRDWIGSKPTYLRWSIYYAVVLMIVFLGVYENKQFIYFQF